MSALARLFVAFAAFCTLASPGWAQPQFPQRGTAPVVDAADIIDDVAEAALSERLDAFEEANQRQFVVATIPSLDGYDITDYGYQLGRHWALGDAENDDGIILLIAPNERKVRIEVGYGLEHIVPDGLAYDIINRDILPHFKAGDMTGGIVAGADALLTQLQLPPEEAARIATESSQKRGNGDVREVIGGGIFLLMFLLFFVLPIITASRGGKRRGGVGNAVTNIILWEVAKAATGHRSGGGWGGGGFGGGGFGGGGFSGGGGSFGGGGASGGW